MQAVAHNLSAMTTGSQLNRNVAVQGKSAEKLASGYRINRAADDTAGLAISEKMRRQVRGLDRGMENIKDGISFCQIADGAMAEINDMLHRLTQLSVQAANGTLSMTDRLSIHDEVSEILCEINRISETTKFNEQYVFANASSFDQTVYVDGVDGFYTLDNPTANSTFFQVLGKDVTKTGHMTEPLTADLIVNKCVNTGASGQGNDYVGVTIDFGNLIDHQHNIKALAGTSFYANCCTDCCPNKIVFADMTGAERDQDVVTIGLKDANGSYFTNAEDFLKSIVVDNGNIIRDSHLEFAYEPGQTKLYMYDIDNNAWSEANKKQAYFCDVPSNFTNPYVPFSTPPSSYDIRGHAESLRIHMGPEVSDGMIINKVAVNTKALGLEGRDCLTIKHAEQLIDAVGRADELVSERRSLMGAYINRLESSYNINSNTHENTAAAESQIRDTDMAREMLIHSRYQILHQAGEAFLTQTVRSAEGVLQLLQ